MIRALAIGALLIGFGTVRAADPVLVDVRQGTDLRLTVSSDGTTLVTDLLGQLWSLPAAGGAATPLTPAGEHVRAPRFSPDGRYVVYERRIDDRWDIWQLDLGDRTTKALTGPPYSEHSPVYADAGRSIVFSSTALAPNSSGAYR